MCRSISNAAHSHILEKNHKTISASAIFTTILDSLFAAMVSNEAMAARCQFLMQGITLCQTRFSTHFQR